MRALFKALRRRPFFKFSSEVSSYHTMDPFHLKKLEQFGKYRAQLEKIKLNVVSRSHMASFLNCCEEVLAKPDEDPKDQMEVRENLKNFAKMLYIKFTGLKLTYNYYYLYKTLDLFGEEAKDIKSSLIRDFLDNPANTETVELNLLFYIDIIDYLNKIDEANKNLLLRAEADMFGRKNYGAVLSINLEKIVNKVITDAAKAGPALFELYTNLLVTLLHKYNEFLKRNFYEQDYGKLSSSVQLLEETLKVMKFETLGAKRRTLQDLLELFVFFSRFCLFSTPSQCVKLTEKIVDKMDFDDLTNGTKIAVVKACVKIFSNCGDYSPKLLKSCLVLENFDMYFGGFNEGVVGLSHLCLMGLKNVKWLTSKLEAIMNNQPDSKLFNTSIASQMQNVVAYILMKSPGKAESLIHINNLCMFNAICYQNHINISDYHHLLITDPAFGLELMHTENPRFIQLFKNVTELEKVKRWGRIDFLNRDELFISNAIKAHFPSIFKNYHYRVYEQYYFSKYSIDFVLVIPELKLKVAIEYFGAFYTFPNGEHLGKTRLKFAHIRDSGMYLVEFKTDENFLRLMNYNDHHKMANILAFSIADVVYKEAKIELDLNFNKTFENIN